MIQIYGSMLCKDCVACRKQLDEAGVAYKYRDFGKDLLALKEFLSIRDSHKLFVPVKKAGKIGIPCIIREDGSVTLSWKEFL